MNVFYGNIEELTLQNKNYREVLATTKNMQLVIMSLKKNDEIGMEIHPKTSQFIRVESGEGIAIIDNVLYHLTDGDVVVVPPGAEHNIINTGNKRLDRKSVG